MAKGDFAFFYDKIKAAKKKTGGDISFYLPERMQYMTDLELLKTAENLKDYAERNLQKSKGNMYCCPACGSGTHGTGNSDGALSIDGNLFKCFSCGAGGSVIDLIKLVEGKDNKEAVKRCRELYDRDYDPYRTPQKGQAPSNARKQEGQKTMIETSAQEPEPIQRDFRNYFKRCRKGIRDTSYPRSRGLDEETVIRFGMGFDPTWTSPTAEQARKEKNKERAREGLEPLPPLTPSPRLIIPLSANNYLARDTRPDSELTEAQKRFKKMNEGRNKPFFNEQAINNPLCFFVVEGELDAISIEQAGGSCIALGSTVKAKAFGELLKKRDALKTGTVIISLDNDPAGQQAAEIIEEACIIAGVEYAKENASGNWKDPNEFLVNDRNGFYKTIRGIIQQVRGEKLAEYEGKNAAAAVKAFMRRPETAGAAIPTGFKNLDKFLEGGLPSGLIFIGGLSSLGKTTLALQIAEHIATGTRPEGTFAGTPAMDVMYFALEQSQNDLISKMLSSRTYRASIRKKKKEKLAKTSIQLIRRDKWKDWPQDEWDNLWECYTDFENGTGKHLFFTEAPAGLSAADIAEAVRKRMAYTGNKVTVFIDYLQILRPVSDKLTDKQAVDQTINILATLARDYGITIIGISSFNRENYWQKVNMTAFKDSGNLEYSADILLAIAPAKMEEASSDKEKKENKEEIEKCRDAKDKNLQLHVLKNRNGKVTGKNSQLFFTYHSWFNYFEEAEAPSYLSNFDNGNPAAQGKIKRVM